MLNLSTAGKREAFFFQFPYSKILILRQSLDVMHIEKNICDSIVDTLLSIDGKSKDNVNSHLDLQAMGIRDQLHPIKRGYIAYCMPFTNFKWKNGLL